MTGVERRNDLVRSGVESGRKMWVIDMVLGL